MDGAFIEVYSEWDEVCSQNSNLYDLSQTLFACYTNINYKIHAQIGLYVKSIHYLDLIIDTFVFFLTREFFIFYRQFTSSDHWPGCSGSNTAPHSPLCLHPRYKEKTLILFLLTHRSICSCSYFCLSLPESSASTQIH